MNHPPNKKILRELFNDFGIRVMMGDLLGAYSISSGADPTVGTDYRNPEQQANMMKSVEAMVREFKDEPYILMWALGNAPALVQHYARGMSFLDLTTGGSSTIEVTYTYNSFIMVAICLLVLVLAGLAVNCTSLKKVRR